MKTKIKSFFKHLLRLETIEELQQDIADLRRQIVERTAEREAQEAAIRQYYEQLAQERIARIERFHKLEEQRLAHVRQAYAERQERWIAKVQRRHALEDQKREQRRKAWKKLRDRVRGCWDTSVKVVRRWRSRIRNRVFLVRLKMSFL